MRKKDIGNPKFVGRSIVIGTIVLALFVAVMLILLFNNWIGKSSIKVGSINDTEDEKVIHVSELYYDNYWSKSIINNIIEEQVPVPFGYEYVQGDINSGVIIKDSETNAYMLWIPYDENASIEGIEEYYQNCDYIEEDGIVKESIEIYGGFYISLEEINQYEALKSIDNETYESAMKQAEEICEETENMNSHLVTKTELAQIKAYEEKIGIKLISTKAGSKTNEIQINSQNNAIVKKLANSNLKAGSVSYTPETYTNIEGAIQYTAIQLTNGSKVYIPEGYKVCVKKANATETVYYNNSNEWQNDADKLLLERKNTVIVKIMKDKLAYTWIPVTKANSLEDPKGELEKEGYKKADQFQYNWRSEDCIEGVTKNTEEYNELKESVNQFGGFYIGEAELGEVKGKITNLARGMIVYTNDEGERQLGINKTKNGDYYRGKSYEEANNICRSLSDENVVSHLTYGCEWDAVMLWIMNTTNLTYKEIIQDSTNVPGAKYKELLEKYAKEDVGTKYNATEHVNGIYGLAGNLAELTQERTNYTSVADAELGEYRYITRGGSFVDSQKDSSKTMASRSQLTEEVLKNDDIGFRNCLYIRPNNQNKTSVAEQNKWTGKIANSFAGGDGTEDTPYQIATPEQLAYLAKIVNGGDTCENKYFKITKDLDLNNIKWTPIGKIVSLKQNEAGTELPGEYFTFKGILDGGEHTISGLLVEEGNGAGLLGYVNGNAVVKNITISSGKVTAGYKYAGGIAAYLGDNVVIEKCINNAEIVAMQHVGGIVGFAIDNGTIENCTNKGELICYEMAAGNIYGYKEDTVMILEY